MNARRVVPFLLFVLLMGCKNDPSGPPSEHQRVDGLIPMKVGYYWVYLFSSYDTTGLQYPPHTLDTVRILRDTLINNELWFIFSDGYVRTNRNDGVWFLSNGEPRLGLPLTLGDSTCTAPQPSPCEYYIMLASVGQRLYVIGAPYEANVYDWIFRGLPVVLGYRYYTVPHLGHVRKDSYSGTLSGRPFLAYSEELLYAFVE